MRHLSAMDATSIPRLRENLKKPERKGGDYMLAGMLYRVLPGIIQDFCFFVLAYCWAVVSQGIISSR